MYYYFIDYDCINIIILNYMKMEENKMGFILLGIIVVMAFFLGLLLGLLI